MDIIYDHCISLGADCGTARAIRQANYKDATYPFDWAITKIKGLIQLIKNDFQEYINFTYDKIGNDAFAILNKTIYLPHECTYQELSIKEKYDMQIDKHKRRAERFITLMNSGKNILLVRKCLNETKEDILNLVEILKEKYSSCKFHLLFFSSQKDNDTLNSDIITHKFSDNYFFVKYNKCRDTYFHSDESSYYKQFVRYIKRFNMSQTFDQIPLGNDRIE